MKLLWYFTCCVFLLIILGCGCKKIEDKSKTNAKIVQEGIKASQTDYTNDPMFIYQRIGGHKDDFYGWFDETPFKIEAIPKRNTSDIGYMLGIRWIDDDGSYLATYFFEDDRIVMIMKESLFIGNGTLDQYKVSYNNWLIHLKKMGFVDKHPVIYEDDYYENTSYTHDMKLRGGLHRASLLFVWNGSTEAGYLKQVITPE